MNAQVSVEFMIYVVILLAILVFAAGIAINTGNDILNERIGADAKRVASSLATEINVAVEVGDGYTRMISIPETLAESINYTISLGMHRVVISWSDKSYSLPVIAANITELPRKGDIIIYNRNGVIGFE
jgi:hypothetical protein